MSVEFCRYIIAGLINTAVGYLAFLVALHFLGMSASISNAFSYAIGLCVAYVINLMFVFRKSQHSRSAFLRFIAGFCVAYLVNLIVLQAAIRIDGLPVEIAQIFAMGSYTVSFYLLNKHFVWGKRFTN